MISAKLGTPSQTLKMNVKTIFFALFVTLTLGACSEKTSEEFIQEAKQFQSEGNNQAAVVALKNAVQKAPREALPRFTLGKLYLELKNYESAEKELSRALELGYAANEVIPLLARALQRTGANVALSEIEIAADSLTSAEQLEVGYRKLQSLVQLEQNLKAEELIADLLLLDSNTVYKGLVQSYQLVLARDFESALAIAKDMYERAPLNPDVLNFTARLYMINDDAETAAGIYEDYIKVAPEDIEAKFALASMLVEQRETERAEKYIDQLLEINDTNPLLNQLKGVVRAADEDYKAAKLFSEKAISGGRADPTLRLVAGLASYQLEEFEAAVGHLSLIASILPDNHPGLRILAASQLQANMGDDAGEVLARVGNIDANDASLFSRAGYALIQSGNTDAAKEIIEQADKISESSEDLTRLGVLKLSVNDIEGLVDLESAVSKAPESVTAKTTLASAYLGTSQLDKAMQLAKQWQVDEPSSVDGFLLESEVLQRQQKYSQAASVLDSAMAIDGTNEAVQIASIRLDLREQNFDQAMAKVETLLTQSPANLPALASYFALKNQAGDTEAGLQKVSNAVAANPEDQNIRLLLARIALALNKADITLDALSVIEADRNAPLTYWPMQGMALLRSNKIDEAERHYQQWEQLYPNQENAVIGSLLIMDGKRQFREGALLASDFLQRKDNVQIKLLHSYFLIMSGNAEGSERVLSEIDERFQPLPFARGIKARIAMSDNRPADAVEDAMVAYDANKNTNNFFLYYRALRASGQSDRSLQVLNQHLNAFPNDARAKMVLAERQIGIDTDAAIKSYREILQDFPNNFVALNNVAYVLMEKGDYDDAMEYASKAYEIQPDNIATADTYAQILVRQNKVEDAVKVYNRVMNDEVTNEEIFLNYIEALLKNGSTVIAERRMGDLTLTKPESQSRLAELRQEFQL
jgi:putative PEP-CTERM system TPR-repeat lipoprotein